jgi:lysyl-tRNA synthetase, class II
MSETPTTDISHDQHAVRRGKLADMRAAGFDPFRANVATTHFSQDAKALYVEGQDNVTTVTVAGRLVTFRVQGGSSFVKIQDQQGVIQLYFRKDVLGEERYLFFKKGLDLGDIIGVTGTCGWMLSPSYPRRCVRCRTIGADSRIRSRFIVSVTWISS